MASVNGVNPYCFCLVKLLIMRHSFLALKRSLSLGMTCKIECGWFSSQDIESDCVTLKEWLIKFLLTHLPLIPHICVGELGRHWFRLWLVAYSAPSYCLNQCWVVVNWNLRNKLQGNFNQDKKNFIHKNASENIVCKMAAILSRGRWVNSEGTKPLPMLIYHQVCSVIFTGNNFTRHACELNQ